MPESEGRDDGPELRPVDPVDRRILEAMADGSWDDLPGMGRPIPDVDRPYEPGWWAKRWVERERRADAADRVRRLIRGELPRLRAARDRAAAQSRVDEINALVAEVNAGLREAERLETVHLD